MTILFANQAVSQLASGIGNTTLSLALTPGTGLLYPSPTGSDYFMATLSPLANPANPEIVKCTARSGDTLTVVRGQENTSAQSWPAGTVAQMLLTAGTAAAFLQAGSAQSPLQTYADGVPGTNFLSGANPFNIGVPINTLIAGFLSGQQQPPSVFSFTPGQQIVTVTIDITNWATIFLLFT